MNNEVKSSKGLLVVISGFSGSGKSSIVKKLISEYDNYSLSISVTTRPSRPREVDGREYFFVDRNRFLNMIKNDELLEYATYVDHLYGTPRAFVENERDKGKDTLLEIELNGAMKVKSRCPEAILVFVIPPSVEELIRRLKKRGTESDSVIKKRLLRAGEEVDSLLFYDYILVNDHLETSVKRLHDLINAEHMKYSEQIDVVRRIRKELRDYYFGR